MSSEGIHGDGDGDSPHRNPRRLSRREKQHQRHTQWKLKKDLEKLNLTSSENAEEVEKAERKPKGLSHKEHQKERKKQYKLNGNLKNLNMEHTVDANKSEAMGDQQDIAQNLQQKGKHDQSGSFVSMTEDGNGNESTTHVTGAPTRSELTMLGFGELQSTNTSRTEKNGLSDVQMDDTQD